MAKILKNSLALIPIFSAVFMVVSCSTTKNTSKKAPYRDLSHFSKVFNREKPYRIYLPKSYKDSTSKTYPVIYYFHGWGGRHNEGGANLAYDQIGKLVDKYQIILVMWNGRMKKSNPRPYNIGYHEHVKYKAQMKDYFPELVAHIDSTYRTVDNRYERGVMGFSMGGMMSFYLAGKYPDKIGAAVDMTGSAEFYIGTPDNHTFYPLRYTFTNLKDVPSRLHNSSHGPLAALNEETNNGALWEGNKNYEYWQFVGGHEIDRPGETNAFEKALFFLTSSLKKRIPRKDSWSHYDLYDRFEVWDYKVGSNKENPGFLYLSDVSKNGFGFYTKQWLPDGPALKHIHATVATAPIYQPTTVYRIKNYNSSDGKMAKQDHKSDSAGRLHFNLDGKGHEIGIYQEGGSPKLTFLDYTVGENGTMLRVGEENKLKLNIANLGETINKGKTIKVDIGSPDQSVVFEPSSLRGSVNADGTINLPAITVHCNKRPPRDGSPFEVKVHLKLKLGDSISRELFSVPVFFDVPRFKNLTIDDGRAVQDTTVGMGNGDGVVSPGEKIMIYTGGHRTQLYYDDPCIVEEQLFDEALPAVWQTDGITFSSIIKISENCPGGHRLKLLAKYETKSYDPVVRNVFWGSINLTVKNSDSQYYPLSGLLPVADIPIARPASR